MSNIHWTLFTVRTRIEMRMFQLDLNRIFRAKVVAIISRITDVARLDAFSRRLDARRSRQQRIT